MRPRNPLQPTTSPNQRTRKPANQFRTRLRRHVPISMIPVRCLVRSPLTTSGERTFIAYLASALFLSACSAMKRRLSISPSLTSLSSRPVAVLRAAGTSDLDDAGFMWGKPRGPFFDTLLVTEVRVVLLPLLLLPSSSASASLLTSKARISCCRSGRPCKKRWTVRINYQFEDAGKVHTLGFQHCYTAINATDVVVE